MRAGLVGRGPEGRQGAVALNGRLINLASIREAEVLVKKAEQVAAG